MRLSGRRLAGELHAVDVHVNRADLRAHLAGNRIGNSLAQLGGNVGQRVAMSCTSTRMATCSLSSSSTVMSMPCVDGLAANTERKPPAAEEPTEATPSTSPTAIDTIVSTTPRRKRHPIDVQICHSTSPIWVSMKSVVASPAQNTALSSTRRWNEMVVAMPSITNSSSARRPRAGASSRSWPYTTSFATRES